MVALPIIPNYASGDIRQIGMGFAGRGWEDFFHSTTRVKPIVPTPREWANVFKRIHIHNPFGLFPEVPANPETGVGKKFPMRFEQVQLAQEMAVRNLITPHNPDQNLPSTVAKRVNALEFVDAALRFPHDIHTYTGAPQRFDRIGRESQRSYTARQIQAIEPLLLVSDRIGLDNTLGSRPAFDPFFNTKNGVIADLVKAITSRGVKVDIEPCNYVSDDWLNLCGKVIAEDFIRDRTRLNKGKSVWDDRVGIKDRTTGMIYHHEPFAIPGTFGEPVMIIADTQYEWSDEQVMVHLQKLHDDYPTADLLVHAGHLPWRLAE